MKPPVHDLDARMAQLRNWVLDDSRSSIRKDWHFDRFESAVAFFNQVAALSQAHDHHPEVWNCYTRLSLRLWTHEASGLTERDFALARAIDQLPSEGQVAA